MRGKKVLTNERRVLPGQVTLPPHGVSLREAARLPILAFLLEPHHLEPVLPELGLYTNKKRANIENIGQ